MGTFKVSLPAESSAAPRVGKVDSVIVVASDAANARAMAKGRLDDDGGGAKWDAADVVDVTTEGDESQFGLEITIGTSPAKKFTASPAADWPTLASDMLALLQADPDIGAPGATLAGGPPAVLTLVGAVVGYGDLVITSAMTLNGVAIAELDPAVNAAGGAAIDRTITLLDPAPTTLPNIAAALSSGS